MSTELARVECKLFCQAIREACWYLGHGSFSAGYRCLHLGLERVCEFVDEEPWAEDIARSYQAALFYYSRLHPDERPQPLRAKPDSMAQERVR